jgi:GNAT superfamily N-acetyltransferase
MEQADNRLAPGFNCGVPVLNDWVQKIAWSTHLAGGARVYVSIDPKNDLLAAYYCLSAAHADRAVVPGRIAAGMGRSGIPVVLIGRFAVDLRFQGLGVGAFMIRHVFERTLNISDQLGVRAIMVEAKDSTGAGFYASLGFTASVSDPLRFFIMLKDVRRSLLVAQTKS